MDTLLPLFPLDLVLFPGAPLPLHVFEPRYREMIGECLAQKLPFGVVRAREQALAEIGCSAEILEVTKKYDDGRLDILTEGRRRFELVEVNQERSFLRAEVIFFEDEVSAASPKQAERAIELYDELLSLAGADVPELEPGEPDLSFHLVAGLPLDLDFKQTLLGLRSEASRLATVVEYYEALLPKMRRSINARKKAGGNGHAL